MTGEGLRFLTSFGMTGERLEWGEGADTAATSIRKTETIVAAVSAPSFFSRRAVIPMERSEMRNLTPNGMKYNSL